jgi:hypothetical protein
VSFHAKAGKSFHKTLAHFSEQGTQPSNFTILVDWGDQSGLTRVSPHRVGKGKFTALGGHRYATPGVFQVMVMIDDTAGQEADAMTTVTVKGKPSTRR